MSNDLGQCEAENETSERRCKRQAIRRVYWTEFVRHGWRVHGTRVAQNLVPEIFSEARCAQHAQQILNTWPDFNDTEERRVEEFNKIKQESTR